jgi:hypothetical protein
LILQEMKIQLSKVILLKDAFSEKPVVNAVRIETPQGREALLRRDGYCLFLNAGQEAFDIRILSPIYKERSVCLQPDGGEAVEEVLLYPSRAYPVRANETIVCGVLPWQTTLWVYLEDSARECRLLQDYEEGNTRISVFMQGSVNREKRTWYIWDKEKEEGEFFQMRRCSDASETYVLTSPLKTQYRKKNALLFPAWECPADENREIYLVFDYLKEKEYVLHYFYMEEEKEVCVQVEISGCRQNEYQF